MQDKDKEQIRSPFDVSGPSLFGAELEKYRSVRHSVSVHPTQTKAYRGGWSLEKTDENKRFRDQNAANFGTRQRRKLK